MQCKHCGATFHGHPSRCPECDGPIKAKKPPFLIRTVFQLVSLIIYIILCVSLLATALLTDIRLLTSSGGIESILQHVLSSGQDAPPPTTDAGMHSSRLTLLSSTESSSDDYTIDENGNIIGPDGSILGNVNDPENQQGTQIPADILTSSDALTDYLYALAQQMLGEDIPVTAEQLQTFIEESTITEFVAEKASSLVDDVLSGTEVTTITAEDIMALVEENQQLIEETFQVELTDEMKQEISLSVKEALGDEDLAEQLRSEVSETMQEPVPGLNGMTVSQLLATVQELSQPFVLILACVLCFALMALLWGLNYYNVPKGLRWSASACTTAGTVLAVPVAILQFFPSLLAQQMPETAELLSVFSGAATVLAPVHYGILVLGVALYVFAALWRILKKH